MNQEREERQARERRALDPSRVIRSAPTPPPEPMDKSRSLLATLAVVRHYPYHNLGDAEGHVKLANDPAWFAEHGCRLAPNPTKLEQAMPRCCGGKHSVRACAITQAGVPHDETLVFYERQCFETRGRAAFIADKMEKES